MELLLNKSYFAKKNLRKIFFVNKVSEKVICRQCMLKEGGLIYCITSYILDFLSKSDF